MQEMCLVIASSGDKFERQVNQKMSEGWELSSSSVIPTVQQSTMSFLPQVRYHAVLVRRCKDGKDCKKSIR